MKAGEQHQLRPASECIWYVLATVAGEPAETEGVGNATQTMQMNRHYWNGLMRERIGAAVTFYESRLDQDIDLPTLTSEDRIAIRAALDARGFRDVQIPGTDSQIDFSKVVFIDFVWFQGYVFGQGVNFDDAKFESNFNIFTNVIFAGDATFRRAEFRGTFFGDDTNFAVFASFDGATFRGAARFVRSRFHFGTSFERASFLAAAQFDSCEFADGVSFSGTEFEDRGDFRQTRFKGRTNFERAEFKALVPEFFGATLNEHTEWHESKWPGIPTGTDQRRDQIQRYQCLIRSMNDLGKLSDQHFFFKKELQIQRLVEPWSSATAMNWCYQRICDYGYGLTRIILIWILHILLGGAILYGSRVLDRMEGTNLLQAIRATKVEDAWALVISFGNAHGFLDLNGKFFNTQIAAWEKVPWFDCVGALQTILGVIILFFLLLTIRNRFRMR